MATLIRNLDELKEKLEQIQKEFDDELLHKVTGLIKSGNVDTEVTPEFEKEFNNSYGHLVADAQKNAQKKAAELDLSKLEISPSDLAKVGDLIIPFNSPRAGIRPSAGLEQNQSLDATQDAGARYRPLDAFKNADESPNDRVPQQDPAAFNLNRDQITSFLNQQTKDLKNIHQLKFKMPMPKPGQKKDLKPELRATALPRPRPF